LDTDCCGRFDRGRRARENEIINGINENLSTDEK